MANRSVIVVGPAACGKTRNAEALRQHFGLDTIIDDAHAGTRIPLVGALVLATAGKTLQGSCGVRVMSYDDAAKAAGVV